jgi:hypothetical protein
MNAEELLQRLPEEFYAQCQYLASKTCVVINTLPIDL